MQEEEIEDGEREREKKGGLGERKKFIFNLILKQILAIFESTKITLSSM